MQKEPHIPTEGEGLPLFYRRPVPLTLEGHRDKGLAQGGDYAFAASSPIVPLYTDEFVRASNRYPIVFSGDECPMPVAILGLRSRNLFVRGDGTWQRDCYVPAYVERYPFIAMVGGDGAPYLAVDADSDHVVQMPRIRNDSVVAPLFDGRGEAAPATVAAADRCQRLVQRAHQTRRFTRALVAAGVLGPSTVHVRTPGGSRIALRGFHVVDRERLENLEEPTLHEWEHKGWNLLIALHLESAHNWQGLVDLELGRAP